MGVLTPRTQSSVAFSGDGVSWFLINASPDIRFQLTALQTTDNQSGRDKVFEAVLLSNGDLDHTLGLLIVREGGPVTTYCTEEIWSTVSEALGFERILGAFIADGSPGIDWRRLGTSPLALETAKGEPTGLQLTTIMLGGSPPRYDPMGKGGPGHACAFVIQDQKTGKKLVCALDVPERNEALLKEIEGADLAILDGTFWSDREMIDLGFSKRTAKEMGHWPISGESGSLQALSSNRLQGSHTVYSHINNTNPILDPQSLERKQVESAKIEVGLDGTEWDL